MENCFLNNAGTQPRLGCPEWLARRMQDPQQHFDLLSNVFMKDCGVHEDQFRIHAVYSHISMEALDDEVRVNLQAMHPHVNLMNPLGECSMEWFCKYEFAAGAPLILQDTHVATT